MSEEQAAIIVAEKQTTIQRKDPTSEYSLLFDPAAFEQAQRASMLLASSDMVPKHLQGKPENVFILLQMAHRMKMDPFLVMQKMYVVHGQVGMGGQLAIALINQAGVFDTGLQFDVDMSGSNPSCTAWGLKHGNRVEAKVDMALVRKNKWDRNSIWNTMTEQMLKYRSAVFLARTECPEALMGMYTQDELTDIKASDEAREKPARQEKQAAAQKKAGKAAKKDDGVDEYLSAKCKESGLDTETLKTIAMSVELKTLKGLTKEQAGDFLAALECHKQLAEAS